MIKKLLALLLACVMLFAMTACGTQPPADGASAEESAAESVESAEPEESAAPEESGEPETENFEELPDEIFATFGEYSIPVLDFAYLHQYIRNQYGGYMYGMAPSEWLDMEEGGKTIRELIYDDAMNLSKEFLVLYNVAASNGFTVTDEERKENADIVVSMMEQLGNDEQEFLNYTRLTPSQVENVYDHISVAARYRDETASGYSLADADLRKAYDANRDQFDQVTVRHVLIMSDESMSAEDQQAAKDKAEGILAQLEGGADIAALAAEHSEDPGSKETGGEYTFPINYMVAEFEQWSFDPARKAGDIGMVKTDYGYHVMQFTSRTGYEDADPTYLEGQARSTRFEEMHPDAYAAIRSEDWTVNETFKQIIVG